MSVVITRPRRKYKMSSYSKADSNAKLTKKVNKLNRKVKHISQLNRYERTLDLGFINNQTAFIPLAQFGTDESATYFREGKSIFVKNLIIRLLIQWNNGAAQQTAGRIVVLMDKQSDGANPLLSDVFEQATAGVTETTTLYNWNTHKSRYKILKDVVITNNNPTTAVSTQTSTVNMNIKVNKTLTYRDETALSTCLGTNQLYIAFIGNVANLAGTEAEVDGYSRLHFVN